MAGVKKTLTPPTINKMDTIKIGRKGLVSMSNPKSCVPPIAPIRPAAD